MADTERATVVVRNFNGRELLADLLPGLEKVVAQRDCGDEILVVDDGSADGSADFVEESFPEVRVERIVPNSGNSIVPVNVGVTAASTDVVICLDNDVLVESDFITPLLKHFEDPDVFAVCPKIVNPNHGDTVESVNYPFFRRGRLVGIAPGKSPGATLPEEPVEVWYAPGSGAAYCREKFLAMGGMDVIYRPIYLEDVDICTRAWRRGWRTVYEPNATTFHLQHATTKKTFRQERRVAVFRAKNNLLFTWKNLMERGLIKRHLLWICLHLAVAFARQDTIYPRALFAALRQAREALSGRAQERAAAKVGDREFFSRLFELHHKILDVG